MLRTTVMRGGPRRGTSAFACLAVVAIFLTWPSLSYGQASPWTDLDSSQIRLISASRAVGEAAIVQFGLQIRLEEGWKTYWRSPGDAGIPPTFGWQGSGNLAAVEVAWPAPYRFTTFGIDSFGYAGEVVFPLAATLERPGEPVRVRAKIDFAACAEICVYHEVELDLALPSGAAERTVYAPLIERYAERVPRRDDAPFAIGRATIAKSQTGERIEISAVAGPGRRFENPDLFLEGPVGVSYSAPRIRFEDDHRRAVFLVDTYAAGSRPSLSGRELRVTLVDGDAAAEAAIIASGPD